MNTSKNIFLLILYLSLIACKKETQININSKEELVAAQSHINRTENSESILIEGKEIKDKGSSCDLRYLDSVIDKVKNNLFEHIVFSINGINSKKIALGQKHYPFFFEKDDLSNHFSPDCKVAWVGAVNKGVATSDDGNNLTYERYYCAFFTLPDACAIQMHTGAMCDGNFDSKGVWVRSDGQESDLDLSARISAANFYDHSDDSNPIASLDNLLRCDPPDSLNIKMYEEIIYSDTIRFSEKERSAVEKKIKFILDSGKESL